MPSIADLVHQTSTSTGTGNLTLSSVNGKQSFATAFGTGVTTNVFWYYISNQGASEWEYGTGHMSDSTTLVRDTVIASTNSNAAVNFSAGTKDVTNDLPASYQSPLITGIREKLSANRTYYVRTDGSNSNNGLANTSGGAFLTLQKAYDVIAATLDLAGYTVTVQVGDGTYTTKLNLTQPWTGGGAIIFQGNSGTPANVLLSTTSSNAIENNTVLPGSFTVKDIKLQTTTSGNCVQNLVSGRITLTNIVFGPSASAHVDSRSPAAEIYFSGSYSIVGGANTHIGCSNGKVDYADSGVTVTLTGTPGFSVFCYASRLSYVEPYGVTFSGSATGQRYYSEANSVILVAGAGANFLPGNSAGATATGGLYL